MFVLSFFTGEQQRRILCSSGGRSSPQRPLARLSRGGAPSDERAAERSRSGVHLPQHHGQCHPVASVGAAAVQDRGRLDVCSPEAARRAATPAQSVLHAGKCFLSLEKRKSRCIFLTRGRFQRQDRCGHQTQAHTLTVTFSSNTAGGISVNSEKTWARPYWARPFHPPR